MRDDEEEAVLIGRVFQGVHAPFMTAGGLPSEDRFFTEADFAGRALTVVNLWDSGCMNCRWEMPFFEQAYENYRDMGVEFLGVATRRIGGTFEDGWRLLNELGITYTNVIIDEGIYSLVEDFFVVPLTLFVNAGGEVIGAHRGVMMYEELEAAICGFICTPGDVDANGRLELADISLAAAYIQNSARLGALGTAAADIDGDGRVSAEDVVLICQAVFDYPECEPGGPKK
jgi:thiol-disulfide isomerase/thioredoxin